VEELGSSMSHAELAQLLERRAHASAPRTPGRAAWLTSAGESWELAGELGRARTCFEEAVEDGGGSYIDPRAELAALLLEMGDTARAEELLVELRREPGTGESRGLVAATVGEALELHGRLEEALAWFEDGLGDPQAEQPLDLDIVCSNGRFRVRRALGLPPDRRDRLAEERRREYAADLESDGLLVASAEYRGAPLMTVLFWPPTELARLLDRWPGLADGYGSDPAEHRLVVERHLRDLADDRVDLAVSTGDFEEYLTFAGPRRDHASDASTRAAYAAHIAHLGRAVPWPPEDAAPCWCGSGLSRPCRCGTPTPWPRRALAPRACGRSRPSGA
jgi:hypothetical protein